MKILITSGPTREPIDPVRFLSNRSSGKMGHAIAAAAVARNHQVVLISGPVRLDPPEGLTELVAVETAREMFEAVRDRIAGCDAAVFCAAVSDYRTREIAKQKIKKSVDRGGLTLELEQTEDILGNARAGFGFQGILVGFAAETGNLAAHARNKLERKACDLLVANDVSQSGIGFDRDENEVRLFFADGREKALPRQSKLALGKKLVEIFEELVKDAPGRVAR